MFQDGKVIFVRHGGFGIKVSANRLIKAKKELVDKIKRKNGDFSITVERATNEGTEEDKKDEETREEKYIPELFVEEREKRRIEREERKEDNNQDASAERVATEIATDTNAVGTEDDQQTPERPTRPTRTQTRSKTITKKKKMVEHDYKRNNRIEWKIDEKWYPGIVTGKAGKATGAAANWMNIQLDDGSTPFSTDILDNGNIRKAANDVGRNDTHEKRVEEVNWVTVKLDNGTKPFTAHKEDQKIRKMHPEDVLFN